MLPLCIFKASTKLIMASIKYHLKTGTTKIYITISNGRNSWRIRKSVNKSINYRKNWNNKKQEVKITDEEPFAKSINTYLSNHKTQLLKGIHKIESKDENYKATKSEYVDIIDGLGGSLFVEKSMKKFSFTEYLKEFIDLAKAGKVYKPKSKIEYSLDTIKGYRTLLSKIEEFEREKYKLNQSNISAEFQSDFIDFFQDVGLKNSYIDKLLDCFKSFVENYLIASKNLEFPKYNVKQWINLDFDDSLSTYLSIEELTKLTYLDLSDKDEKWNIIRDVYCFNAFTCGMRVKDLMRLKEHNIVTKLVDGEKKHYLTFRQGKTGKPVKAPIPKIGMEILKKYDGKLPHLSSDVESNEILKKLGKMCGFTDYLDPIVDKKNNILVKKRKYELITNHTARRSFCTNTYNQGVDILQIMAISGHSSPNVLLGYIGVTLDEYADKMLDTKYFKAVDNITQDFKMKAV